MIRNKERKPYVRPELSIYETDNNELLTTSFYTGDTEERDDVILD